MKLLLDRQTIQNRIKELARDISVVMQGRDILLIPLMDGGMIFAADLMREISLPMNVRSIRASSYGKKTISSGKVDFPEALPEEDLENRDLLLVDDILETGGTLVQLRERLLPFRPRSIRTCVLLRKEAAASLPADHVGFEIPNHFVVGYGLDYAGRYRNLPDIRILDLPSDLTA